MSEIDLQSLSSAEPEGEEIWQHIDEKVHPNWLTGFVSKSLPFHLTLTVHEKK